MQSSHAEGAEQDGCDADDEGDEGSLTAYEPPRADGQREHQQELAEHAGVGGRQEQVVHGAVPISRPG